MLAKEKKEEIDKRYPVMKIIGFTESEVQDYKLLGDLNNTYIGLQTQYEQFKKNIYTINEIIDDLVNNKIIVENLMVPFGNGLLRRVDSGEKQKIVDMHKAALEQETIKINSVLGQLQHRGDALGEQRLRMVRSILVQILNQHGYTKNDFLQQLGKWWNITIPPVNEGDKENKDKIKDIIEKVK